MNKAIQQADKQTLDVTDKKPFRPTPHMIVWLDAALQLMTDNISEIERACNITAKTWHEWQKNDEFRLWYRENWDKRIASHSWKLDVIGMKNAKRDHKYWEGMQKRVGNFREEKDSSDLNIQINVMRE